MQNWVAFSVCTCNALEPANPDMYIVLLGRCPVFRGSLHNLWDFDLGPQVVTTLQWVFSCRGVHGEDGHKEGLL